jgi:hypothetical protein
VPRDVVAALLPLVQVALEQGNADLEARLAACARFVWVPRRAAQ